MRLNIVILYLLLVSCSEVKQLPPLSFINNPIDTTKIHFNGFYSTTIDTSRYKGIRLEKEGDYTSRNEVVFTKKQKIVIYAGASKNNEPLYCNFYKNSYLKNMTGLFTIKNDSIYAYVPIFFYTKFVTVIDGYAYYRGYLKNKDTITDWKVIKPYPKKIGKVEMGLNQNWHLFRPQTLYFVKTDAVKCLQID